MPFSIPNVTVTQANIGTIPNSGTGDTLRAGIQKINNSLANLATYSNTIGLQVGLDNANIANISANLTVNLVALSNQVSTNTTNIYTLIGNISTLTGEVATLSNNFVIPNHINANYTIQTSDAKGVLTVNTTALLHITVPNTMIEGFTCDIVAVNSGNVGIFTDNSSFLNGAANSAVYMTPNVRYRLIMPLNSTGNSAAWFV